jgi:hypothetical protein
MLAQPTLSLTGYVNALTVANNTLYVAGSFASVLGTGRSSLAAVDLATNQLLAWNPSVSGSLSAILVRGQTVFIGGSFATVGTTPRANIAWIDASSGSVLPFDLAADSEVFAFESDGTTLFVGGRFGSLGNQPRRSIAAIDIATQQLLPWTLSLESAPGTNGPPEIKSIALNGSALLLGGQFGRLQANERRSLGAVDAATAQLLAWNPRPSSEGEPLVYALLPTPTGVAVGGRFRIMGGQLRNGTAAIDLATGELLPWQAQVPGVSNNRVRVLSMVNDGSRVFISGVIEPFPSGGGTEFLFAFDGVSGAHDAGFVAFTQGAVRPMAVTGTHLCLQCVVAGAGSICGLDLATGDLAWYTPVNSGLRATIFDVALQRLLVSENNQAVRALSIPSGVPAPWTVSANNDIGSLALNDQRLYLAGAFGTIGPVPRAYIAALDFPSPNAPVLSGWSPQVNGQVTAMAVRPPSAYISGAFTTIGGIYRPSLAAVSLTVPAACDWAPNVQGATGVILTTATHMIALGSRARAGSRLVERILVFDNVPCFADFNHDCIRNVLDFISFQNAFAAGDASANCDGSTLPPVLNVNDFSCFLNAYASGCM